MTDRLRTVALTGATGFVGAAILNQLTGDGGISVRALCRQPQPARQNVTWISGSLEDHQSLERLARGADAVIHCAGLVKARKAAEFAVANIAGTRNVARAADTSGRSPHMVLISSLAARETLLSDYADSKLGAETAMIETLGKRPWTILRPSAVYGPGDREILKLLRAMKRGIAPAPGSGQNRFSLIHVDDLARAVSATLWRSEAHGGVYEIDDGCQGGYTMTDIAAIAANALDRKVRMLPLPYSLLAAAGGINELMAMAGRPAPMLTRGKARELAHADWTVRGLRLSSLGFWTPKVSAREGLTDTIEWYRNEGLL